MPRTRQPRNAATRSPLPENVRLTHPDRVVFPDLGTTKHQVAEYYAQVAPWILPHVAGRPLVLVRCPEGIAGPHFFQKHPPTGLSETIERIQVREKHKTETYLVLHDLAGILALVQFGVLEYHVWGAHAASIERPDQLIFDLDPDVGVPWKRVTGAAVMVREALAHVGLVSFVKTTGGKGLHVVAPVERRSDWPEVKNFCKALAEVCVNAAPTQFTSNLSKAARRGRIFIDYLRNERGASAIAPYSTRAREGALVAAPLAWEELSRIDGAASFSIVNIAERLTRLKRDPWERFFDVKQSITASARKRLGLAAGKA
jgi:bifunctional non-homologous end joining protein LigD